MSVETQVSAYYTRGDLLNSIEGETLLYKPDPSGTPKFVARIRAEEWVAQSTAHKS